FGIDRLGESIFAFRKSIAEGRTLGQAAEAALDVDSDFDPTKALAELFRNGLVTAIAPRS
ncbi:MAG: hypothetical protein ACRD5F_03690, partial [Candidatus Acidiferrales bacterium]